MLSDGAVLVYTGPHKPRIYASLPDRILICSVTAPESHPLTNGTPCWFWCGQLDRRGYPTMSVKRRGGRSRTVRVHREAVRVFKRLRVGKRYVVRHDCDTPWCVNPAHLRGGTPTANMRDMIRRGRGRNQFGAVTTAPVGTPIAGAIACHDPDERYAEAIDAGRWLG